MADRPILFSAPMVRAILREIENPGTGKTQTRRIIKPRGNRPSLFNGNWSDSYVLAPGNESWRQEDISIKPGDRLYVREHWRTTHVLDGIAPSDLRKSENKTVNYTPICFISDEATQDFDPLVDPPFGKHRQAMHMPRWASRLTLIVEGVKVERLQDISEADAIAEGIERHKSGWMPYSTAFYDGDGLTPANYHVDPRISYMQLWNSINGSGSWDANQWVVAYTFRPILGNIDQIGGAA
ncbi:MAG: hypothetical protein DI589_11230 [Shinella sp.]|nr:MAG: hypothetical protein DI589_11230 [Shinella sp.]